MSDNSEAERAATLWLQPNRLFSGYKSSATKFRRFGTGRSASVIGIDPGGTTGFCVLRFDLNAFRSGKSLSASAQAWTSGQVHGDEIDQVKKLAKLARALPDSAVVIEDFILRTQDKSRAALSPVRITAMLEFALSTGEPTITWHPRQQPSLAKSTATDARLSTWGFYRREGGEVHARDAVRHALTFARRLKENQKLFAEFCTQTNFEDV